MALAASSYSSVAAVLALTRHYLDGDTTFGTNTQPTLTEVEGFIDEISSELNDAIRAVGFAIPISAASPKRSCDLWVRTKAAAMVELTARGTGFDGTENERYAALWRLIGEDAYEWAMKKKKTWSDQGVTLSTDASDGFTYTGLNKHSERADPDSTTKEQPLFRRRQFEG